MDQSIMYMGLYSFALFTITLSIEDASLGVVNPYKKPEPTQDTFRVAVFDQGASNLPPFYTDIKEHVVTMEDVIGVLEPILNGFSTQAARAKALGADMIVFPESGILPRGTSRDDVEPFLETVPSPGTNWTPCPDPTRHNNTYIQYMLSCMAANNSMYVIANMGDVDYCGESCHPSGRLQYNTNIVYDPTGKLVARYHKQNLFFEPRFDTPTTTDYSYFDTPFGRFGTFVCFDVLFKKPPLVLIEEYRVDHIAFPTAWMNVLPYFSAVPFHQSFALGHGVNFASANLHYPNARFSGSGVYASNTTIAFRNDDDSDESALLIGDLQSRPPKIRRQEVKFTSDDMKSLKKAQFQSEVFGDLYNFVTLDKDEDDVMICHDATCCHLVYTRNPSGTNSKEHFALGAFRGLHTKEGTYFIEVCVFMKCGNASQESCGEWVKRSETYFSSFKLTGNFTTKYVYPQVTTDKVDPSPGQWAYDGRSISSSGTEKPFLSAVFFARRYDLDTIDTRSPSNFAVTKHPDLMTIILLFTFAIVSKLYSIL